MALAEHTPVDDPSLATTPTTPPILDETRTLTVRTAARQGAIMPACAALYAACTWNQSNRIGIVGVAVSLAIISWAVAGSASRLSRSPWRRPVIVAGVVAHLTGYTALAHLDGGIDSPLGTLLYVALPFVAISVPALAFAVLSLVSVGGYLAVAVVGGAAPPGHAFLYTVGYLGLSVLCARHAHSLASLRRELTRVTRIDPLTGCLNRRGFAERLTQELSRSQRTGSPLTLVTVDLDSFKTVNDTLGHQAGDELLAWTASALADAARAHDAVGRLGGDEFAVILTGVGPDRSAAVIERLQTALDGVSPASMGAASHPSEAATAETLHHLADQRAYVAKGLRAGESRPRSINAVTDPDDRRQRGAGTPAVAAGPERRRRSIVDMGVISLVNGCAATFYLVFLAPPLNQTIQFTLTAVGMSIGLALALGARRLASSGAAAPVLRSCAVFQFGIVAVVVALDGGLASPLSIGLLTPLPLIALSTLHWVVLPLSGSVGVVYVALGVVQGGRSAWQVIAELTGIAGITWLCSIQGRMAAHQRHLLTTLSHVDSLTGCLNRRGFEQRVATAVSRARRERHAVSVLTLDLDDFKQLNDSAGHAAGDELLCWVAAAVGGVLRTHDIVGRLGGDEFSALLVDCPYDRAAVIADRVRNVLAERTPASIGTATLDRHGDDIESLFRHADGQLYTEKARRKARRP